MIRQNLKHNPTKFLSPNLDNKPRSSKCHKKATCFGTQNNSKPYEDSRIQESLFRAFDENDSLRSRIVELESLLVVIQIERDKKRHKGRIFERPLKINKEPLLKRSRSI